MQRVPRNYGDRTGVDEHELALQNTLPEVIEGALEELGEIYHI